MQRIDLGTRYVYVPATLCPCAACWEIEVVCDCQSLHDETLTAIYSIIIDGWPSAWSDITFGGTNRYKVVREQAMTRVGNVWVGSDTDYAEDVEWELECIPIGDTEPQGYRAEIVRDVNTQVWTQGNFQESEYIEKFWVAFGLDNPTGVTLYGGWYGKRIPIYVSNDTDWNYVASGHEASECNPEGNGAVCSSNFPIDTCPPLWSVTFTHAGQSRTIDGLEAFVWARGVLPSGPLFSAWTLPGGYNWDLLSVNFFMHCDGYFIAEVFQRALGGSGFLHYRTNPSGAPPLVGRPFAYGAYYGGDPCVNGSVSVPLVQQIGFITTSIAPLEISWEYRGTL